MAVISKIRHIHPIFWIWLVWFVYWRISGWGNKPNQRQETLASRASHLAPLFVGVLLIVLPGRLPGLGSTIVIKPSPLLEWCATALVAAGLGFAVWARVHLGKNWSSVVTLKQEHELIRSGPYALVRHPIYTGLLLGFLGSALARGGWLAGLGFLFTIAGLVRKLSIEERWMEELFGQQYQDYRRRIAALIPFVF